MVSAFMAHLASICDGEFGRAVHRGGKPINASSRVFDETRDCIRDKCVKVVRTAM